jgi:hypothetical protein
VAGTATVTAAGADGKRQNVRVPRITRLVTRRAGPIGLALTAWDIYRRLPPKQRRWLMAQARQHGPTLAKRALKARRARR